MNRVLALFTCLFLVVSVPEASSSEEAGASEVNALAQQMFAGTGSHLLVNLHDVGALIIDFLLGTVSRDVLEQEYSNLSGDYSQALRALEVEVEEFASLERSWFVRDQHSELVGYFNELATQLALVKEEADAVYRASLEGKNPELFFQVGRLLSTRERLVVESEIQLLRGLRFQLQLKQDPTTYHFDALIGIKKAVMVLFQSIEDYYSGSSVDSIEQNLWRSAVSLGAAREAITEGKKNLSIFFAKHIDPFYTAEHSRTLYDNFLETYQIDLRLAVTVDEFRRGFLSRVTSTEQDSLDQMRAMRDVSARFDVNYELLKQELDELFQQRLSWAKKVQTQ